MAGGTNDYIAYKLSKIQTAINSLPPGYYVLGDPAYPLSEHLLTSFVGASVDNNEEALGRDDYNFFHSQLR